MRICIVLNVVSLIGYLIYYFKVKVTNKLTYLFLAINLVASLFVSKIVFVSILSAIIALFIRDYGNTISKAVPVAVYIVFAVLGLFINFVITRQVNWAYAYNILYLIPTYIIYLIEASYVVYKEESNG